MSQEAAFDVLSFGEALVDFLPSRMGARLREIDHYTRCLGGAPANLAYGVAMLGGRSAFMGRCGDDEFGYYLREKLQGAGVDVTGVTHTLEARTGIVFIEIDEKGERSFTFYRHPSADSTITAADVDLDVVRKSAIVHSGTNLMTLPGPREANLLVLSEAAEAGRLVSLDANIRLHHWPDPDAVRESILHMLQLVDMLKVNEDETTFLFGQGGTGREIFDRHLAPRQVSALLMTLGGGGATVITAQHEIHVAAPDVEVLDTTGAGDAFLAGALRALSILLEPCGRGPGGWRQGLRELDEAQWRSALSVANFAGASVCTSFGATTAVPTLQDVPWERFGLPRPA